MKSSAFTEAGKMFGFAQKFEEPIGGQSTVDVGKSEANMQTVSVTYSEDVISELLYMIEEEKLAGDIYEAFYDLYGLQIFDNIAESEDKHFEALINKADKMGVDVDEFLFEPSGTFVNEDLQSLYDSLLETGSLSVTDALAVGVMIEEKDMVDIVEAAEAVEGTALASVYDNLLAGSQNHLEAFESALLL